MRRFLPLLLLLLIGAKLSAKHDFYKDLQDNDPAKKIAIVDINGRLKSHIAYFNSLKNQTNSNQYFYALCYLHNDYYTNKDEFNARNILLQIESCANEVNNDLWKAVALQKRGLAHQADKNNTASITCFKKALQLFTMLGDSAKMGTCLEYLAESHVITNKWNEAEQYFASCKPLLFKHADSLAIANYYNNYSVLKTKQGNIAESLITLDSAIAICQIRKDLGTEMIFTNNKAFAYTLLGQHAKAIKIYNTCLKINQENHWPDKTIKNYQGLYASYDMMGKYEQALENFSEYVFLEDSLHGVEQKNKIKDLELQSIQQKLQTNQTAARQNLEKIGLLVVGVLCLGFYAFMRIRKKKFILQQQQQQNEKNLNDLTRILITKNERINSLMMQVKEATATLTEIKQWKQQSTVQPSNEMQEQFLARAVSNPLPVANEMLNEEQLEIQTQLTNQPILTPDDWNSFKYYFEKLYPNYIYQLRTAHPTITDAEERLFLLLKLNIKTKEAASMLGISADSVKKTRNRLRKKLQLTLEVDLEEYIQQF
jgi:tetratricopeptide (TPR) repeat protein/DNA-binding CsgD family transcriptional regulator